MSLYFVFIKLLIQLYPLFQNDDEREMCTRTIYCTNIDKKVFILVLHHKKDSRLETVIHYTCIILFVLQVTQADIKLFFESVCGEVCEYTCCKLENDILLDGTTWK